MSTTKRCSPVPTGPGHHPRFRRLIGGGLALLAGLGTVLGAPARPAYAHAQLIGTSPVNGERLATGPLAVVLRFSEPVNLVRDGIRILGPAGPVAGTEPARVGTQVRIPLPAALGSGVYTVSWRVVSIDSHPIHGAFVFGVGSVDVGALPAAEALTDVDPALSATFWLFRWLGYASLALLAGGVCFLVLCWPPGWTVLRSRRVVAAGWVGSLACAVAVLLLQGPYAAGGSLAGVGDLALLGATLGTDYGRFVVVRLGVLLLGAALIVGWALPATREPGRRLSQVAGAVFALALPATWVGTGHANAGASLLPAVADTAHLSAMAVWFGGLVVLMSCVLSPSTARETPEVSSAVARFSRIATVCVGVLVGTGTYQAWRGVGSLAALSGSTYGSLLVFKLAAVCVLLWFGWMSRSMVLRRFVLPAPAPAMARSGRRAERVRAQDDLLARRRLAWSVRSEAFIAVAVIALTAMLVATPPGARPEVGDLDAIAHRPVLAQLAISDGGQVEVRLAPAERGSNSLTLAVRRSDATAWDVPEVRAALFLPAQDIGPLPVALNQVGPGAYAASTVDIPVAGTWRLQVTVRTSEIDETTVATDIPAT